MAVTLHNTCVFSTNSMVYFLSLVNFWMLGSKSWASAISLTVRG